MAAKTPEHGSQNVLFVGEVEREDVECAPGLPIVEKMEEALRNRAWEIIEPFENRDGAMYDMIVKRASAEMRLLFAGTEKDTWMLQIAPSRSTGRFRHKVSSATPTDIFSLAEELHEILFVDGSFRDPKWCWDGFPGEMETFPEPPGPDVPAVVVGRQLIYWSRLRPRDARERKDCLACLFLAIFMAVGIVLIVRDVGQWLWRVFH